MEKPDASTARLALIAHNEPRGSTPAGSRDSRTVLIIEDNEDNRTIYRAALTHFGYRVLEAENGRVGIALARQAQPAVIVMDLSMPVLDGIEATYVLKRDPTTSHIPVIVVTAHTAVDDVARARLAGCDGFVEKPVSIMTLVGQIARYVPMEVRLGA